MNKKIFTLIITILSYISSFAQTTKSTATQRQTWIAFSNQTRLSDKWGFWGDFNLRTKEEFTQNLSQIILRPGLTYYANDNTKLTVGYAYVVNYPSEADKHFSQPEHRIWQQLQWHTKYTKTKLMQWIRLEEKYRHKILNDSTLANGYNFNYKFRYNLFWDVPLRQSPNNKVSFIVNDEVHINFGKQIIYNYFDQNRFFIGFKFDFNKHENLQLGYMNQFQQLPEGNKYRNNHIIRVFFAQNLDWRRKKAL
ncbi:DUF2490 domain-containing protein [Segetibacter koreensis]|uniref:DUF2490 domain-containing protein n=1 Tax=Segetibacter koreensis TaxID=398037 RepID=UPI00035F0F65|nr:DUF2490 domain-containing protein [Segetibacter koreensis]